MKIKLVTLGITKETFMWNKIGKNIVLYQYLSRALAKFLFTYWENKIIAKKRR